ncbi:TM1802 family CRISPR-associated protein [Phaeodactylibacter xiamenensis]|uniref:TM1802 family CRISPR-associated protein n=1 Tax=Phaeodactylibacter xiamenensis TaxID=1524460 RepID=UPI0024A7A58B|nr:TM1802 family CRISPR-associated protein [Phaeodactylibacter xiamenensis]
MIKTLYDIGKTLSELDKYAMYYEPYSNPFPDEEKAQDAKVVVVHVSDQHLGKIDIENFSNRRIDKYLFRQIRGANGTNLVPTFYFPLSRKADKEKWEKEQATNLKKLCKKISSSIKNYAHDFLVPSEVKRLEALLLEKSRQLNKDGYHLLTMKVEGKYFGEYETYKDLFETEAYAKYHDQSSAKNKVCSVTYQQEAEVWGRIDTLGFTVNDNAFSRNGFSGKHSYKMLPVSPAAAKILEGTKELALNEFSRRFYSLQYLILPHFILSKNDKVRQRAVKAFVRNVKDGSLEETGQSIIHNEKILYEITQRAELQDGVFYDIIFYQQQQAQFLIKLQLNDVMPSRLQKLFSIKRFVEKRYQLIVKRIYKDPKNKEKTTAEFKITFSGIKDFFSKKVKNDYIYEPYFFKTLEAVFYGRLLNEKEIFKAFIKRIRLDFKQQNEEGKSNTYIRRTKDAFVIYQFFKALGLFKNRLPMEEKEKQSVSLTTEGFIDQHSDFFDSEYKKGVFRLGNLSAYLMGKQYKKLNNTPFMKQLNSLNIDEKTITKILPKLISKLREYETALPELEQSIAKSLVYPNKLSKDEISYTFTLGLVMQREFSKAYRQNQEEEE